LEDAEKRPAVDEDQKVAAEGSRQIRMEVCNKDAKAVRGPSRQEVSK